MKNSAPLIIAHRGASAIAPENTLAAFRRAVEDGAEGIEFDVRLARDGVPVVFHDETLLRLAGSSFPVAELTAEELGKVDVGNWFGKGLSLNGSEPFREYIPTLAQTLEFLSGFPGRIFIELKCGDDDVQRLATAVCEVVAGSPLRGSVIVKSFRLAVIPQVKMLLPDVKTAALFAPKIMNILRKEKHLVSIAEEFGADELSLHYALATRKLMEKAEKRGLPVNIWTADNPRWVKRGLRLGLSSIITNDPAKLLARRNELLNARR